MKLLNNFHMKCEMGFISENIKKYLLVHRKKSIFIIRHVILCHKRSQKDTNGDAIASQ